MGQIAIVQIIILCSRKLSQNSMYGHYTRKKMFVNFIKDDKLFHIRGSVESDA